MKGEAFRKTFFILVNKKNAQNQSKKYWQDLSVNLSKYPRQEKQWPKYPLYIYSGCQAIFNFYSKLHSTPEWNSLSMKEFQMSSFVSLESSVLQIYAFWTLKEKHDFVRLIFSLKKFQEIMTKSLFLNFQNSFLAEYFPMPQEPIGQESSLIHPSPPSSSSHYGKIIESPKYG